jgi:general secretion pathway protein D
MLISLVQERRKANVLNVPSVLVNNNGSARVSSKEFQPTTNITAFGGGAGGGQTQESFNDYVDAGITMEISPSISARNFLRLSISLQVSTFIGAVSGSVPPPKTERTIETTVNVPDGDTMVIGGIIIDNTQQTKTQVPFLGDIPILGHLFKRQSDSQDRTALYFFVTPHIMSDLEFADLYEISYQKKQEAADAIGAGRIRQVDPGFGKDDTPYGLSGFDVPIYSSPGRGEVDPADVGLDDQARQNRLLEEAKKKDEQGGEDGR